MGLFDFIRRRRKDPQAQLRELLAGYELPSFPSAVIKTLEMLRDPDAPLAEISRNIEADPGMHVSVLKAVNSAAHGLTRKVGNIKHAIMLLGRARLEAIILPIAVKNAVPASDLACLNQRLFWQTCSKRACIARAIARRLNPRVQMESFTAGLLQDMAIPVLIYVKKSDYCTTIESWNEDKALRLHELEREHFGFDHQVIGALMAERWGFPDYLLKAILYHHSPSGDSEVAKAVKAVSHIRYPAGAGSEQDNGLMISILEGLLKMQEEDAMRLLERAEGEAAEFSQVFV